MSIIGIPAKQSNIHRHGYTLVELILVVLIIGLAAGMAVPNFIRSYKGAKLRTSARSIVMAHRFARSVAVLHQKSVAVYYYTEQNRIEVVSLKPAGVDEESVPSAEGEPVTDYAVELELTRKLEDGVKIRAVEMEVEDQHDREAYWANYYPNGMCDAYRVNLLDEQNRDLWIEVDPLSGKAVMEGLDD